MKRKEKKDIQPQYFHLVRSNQTLLKDPSVYNYLRAQKKRREKNRNDVVIENYGGKREFIFNSLERKQLSEFSTKSNVQR